MVQIGKRWEFVKAFGGNHLPSIPNQSASRLRPSRTRGCRHDIRAEAAGAESARSTDDTLRKLPHEHQLGSIRAIPEFSHDSTRYPLRGMHEKVSCTGCHTKPVFTDVGKNCADCHADIHRAQFGKELRPVPHGSRLASIGPIDSAALQPVPAPAAVLQCEECHKNAAVGNYLVFRPPARPAT